MNIFFWFLSAILFVDSLLLILLILVQQPKKDAGAGMAFGGSTADALFGSGSGNALTTITKYSAGIFFGLAVLMAVMTAHRAKPGGNLIEEGLTSSSGAISSPSSSNSANMLTAPLTPMTNVAPAAGSNSAPAQTSAAEKSAATTAAPAPTPATNNK